MSDTDLAFQATLDGSGFASGAQQITGHLNQMGVQTNAATANLGGLGTVLGTLANPATAAALGITAIGGAIASSVSVAANFESAMSRVASVSGASAAELKQMSDAAREAGASSVFSASQAADAMYFLASSGMTVNQQMAALPETLNLASAGGLELARSAEIMTSTLAQFQLGADQAGRVSNVFAAASAATNTDVTQLGEAMKAAGPMASSLGMSIEQTTAAIGSLSNAGIKGSEAGTALKSMLGSMMQETKTGAAALSELGLTYEDINPATQSYADIMGVLAENGMTASQAVAIFGKEQASAAIAAVNGAAGLGELEEKITGTSKATEMSAQMTENFNGAMEELGGAVEEAQITLGNALLPSLTSGVKFLTDMTNAATDTAKAFGDLAGAWNDWVASTVTDSAALEKQYEDTNKGHWEMMAGDAVWISDAVAEATETGLTEGSEAAKDAVKSTVEGAVEDGGKAGFKRASEELRPYLEAGMKDLDILAMMNSQSSKANETFDRMFEYAGKSLRMHLSEGTSDNWGLFSGDTLLGLYQGPNYSTGLEAFQAITGLPGPKEGTAEYFRLMGDAAHAEKIELMESLKSDIHIADVIFGPEEAIKAKAEELGGAATDALSDGIVTQAERMEYLGLAQDLDTLKRDFPEIFGQVGGESAAALVDALKKEDFAGAMKALGAQAGKSFADALGANIKPASINWSKLLDLDGVSSAGMEDYINNMFQPEIISLATENLEMWNKGTDDYRNAALRNIAPVLEYAEANKQLFTEEQLDAIADYNLGLGDLGDLLERIAKDTKELVKDTNSYSAEMDATTEACNGMLSAFGTWQEKSPWLFKSDYVGPSWGIGYEAHQLEVLASKMIMDKPAIGSPEYDWSAEVKERYWAMSPYEMNLELDPENVDRLREELVARWPELAAENGFYVPLTLDAENSKTDLDEIESKVDSIATKAENIQFSRSASAAPDALKQGIFETSAADPRTSQPQMAGSASQGLSNAALSAMQRYLSQIANQATQINNGIRTSGQSILAAVQTAGNNTAAAVNANGSNVVNSVNSQGSAIIGTINAGVAAIVSALSSKGGLGGPHAGMGGLGSVGGVWDGLNPSAGSLAMEYGIFETAYSEGGYASRPTIALVGDSPGGEFMVPRDRVGEFVNSYMAHQQTKIDGSGMGSQLMEAVGSLDVPVIHIPAVVDIDSEAIYEAVEYAFKSISSDIRLRARI